MHVQTNSFGAYLRYLRKRMGMTQGDLAAAVGYSVALISALETNRRLPTLDMIAQSFVPALGLTDEPRLAKQLIAVAAHARGEEAPVMPVTAHSTNSPHRQQDVVAQRPFPAPPTPIIGRDDEIERLCDRLLGHVGRLLTLIGPPGVGKTRLGMALAARLQRLYRDGSHFITLAAIENPQLVASEIVTQLGLHNQAKKPPQQQLVEYLRHKEMLLLVDNFEQLINDITQPATAAQRRASPATLLVATLLTECPHLCIIVTSRERLHLRAEQRHHVQPLDLAAAMALFVERAAAMAIPSALINGEEALIEAICRQLDCLPLAIELAAARLDVMTPAALLVQLQLHRLDLLTDGAVDLPPHQQTLRRAIDGSYALLAEPEQWLLRRLALYVGGFDPAAVNACGAACSSLERLLNKSLIYEIVHTEERRFGLLQTIRAFALEMLAASGEEMDARRHHAHYFCTLAERVAEQLRGLEKASRLEQLDREHDNFRAALGWAINHAPELALRLAVALEEFWSTRGYDSEAERWLQAALDSSPAPTVQRVRGLLAQANVQRRLGASAHAADALAAAGALLDTLADQGRTRLKFHRYSGWHYYDLHDYTRTIQSFEAGLALARRGQDQSSIVQFIAALAHVQQYYPEHRPQVVAYLDEALSLLNALDEPETLAFVLQQYGGLEVEAARYAVAVRHYERLLTIYRQLGNKLGLAWGLALIGEVAWFQGEFATAAAHYTEAHSLFMAMENPDGIMSVRHHLGQVARQQGRLTEAAARYRQSLQVADMLNNRHMLARCLAGLGAVALAQDDGERAALLTSAAQQLFDALPPFLAPPDQQEFLELIVAAGGDGAVPGVAAAWTEGAAMAMDRVVGLVLLTGS